ncbi:MAG: putative lipid II flippase FtsW [Fuerstiella sp.]|nr:putative lipid II flippase FtsW [Fuerstiella sp.]
MSTTVEYPFADTLRTCSEELLREQREMRRLFVGLVCVLIGVGIQMVHSASLTSMPSEAETVFLSRHLVYLALATCCGLLASRIRPSTLQQLARPGLIGFVILLVLVLVPGIGSRVNGSQRWLRFAELSIQPSELGRLILPVVAAKLLTDLRSKGFRLRTIPRTVLPLVLVLPLVAREPDLGAMVFLAAGFVIALFIGGWPLRYFALSLAVVIPAGASLMILRSYQMQRITGFIAAWKDLSEAPWQIRQSLLSIGAGGLHGTGVGSGWQKLSYLPEANTDFVFAVIGEELGLTGTLTLIIIWMGVLMTGQASLRHLRRETFAWILGNTLVIQLVLQALANVAVVTAMIPPKGVPHPFISYGGTNLLVNVVGVGIVVAMAREGGNSSETPSPVPEVHVLKPRELSPENHG